MLAQLGDCRTARMGGHAWYCDDCGAVLAAYDSCRNRHCPTCRGAARAKWLDRVCDDLLPVPYFHVVHTLPHERVLNRLVLANRALLFTLLFRATAATLLELAADPGQLGARIGLLMVLHTWGQLMDSHFHVHVVVPGGGLSLDGTRWISFGDRFFIPVRVISALFRGKFLAGLKQLWRAGKLKLDGELSHLKCKREFESWLSTLYEKDWVVYAQGPPAGVQGGEAVLKYLARYVSGVAISDRRLVSDESGRVTFRWKNYRRGGVEQTTSLPSVEFIRRYLTHVLPRGLVRIRYYGLLSNRRRRQDLVRCRVFIGDPCHTRTEQREEQAVVGLGDLELLRHREPPRCPRCGRGRLKLLETWTRVSSPAWRPWSCQAEVHDPRMDNTLEEFMARSRSQPTTEAAARLCQRDTS